MRTRAADLFVLLLAFLLCGAARADLEVNDRTDTVELVDGTIIDCVVLMVADKGALIVEGDAKDKEHRRQRLIPKDQIAHITHGKAKGSISGYQTDTELARKVIQGNGYRQELKTKPRSDEVKGPQGPVGPISLESAKLTDEDKGIPVPSTKLTAQELRDSYFSRFPELKTSTQGLLGNDRAGQVLDQAMKGDPLVRRQVEGFLSLVLSGATQASSAEAVTPVKNAKPPKKPRKEGDTPPAKQPGKPGGN